MIHEICKYAKSVVLCLVIRGASLENDRSAGFLRIMTSVMRMLSDAGRERCKMYVLPLLNNVNNFARLKQVQNKIQSSIDFMKLKQEAIEDQSNNGFNQEKLKLLDQYGGAQYPGYHEYEDIQIILNSFMENFKCVDPCDEDIDKWGDHKMTIGEVKATLE